MIEKIDSESSGIPEKGVPSPGTKKNNKQQISQQSMVADLQNIQEQE